MKPEWPLLLSAIFPNSTSKDVYQDSPSFDTLSLSIAPIDKQWGRLKPQRPSIKAGTICRFSIRISGQSGPWQPNSPIHAGQIKSGDTVNLYCHSVGLGPFANDSRPPACASPALIAPGSHELVFPLIEDSFSPGTRRLIESYDNNTLSSSEKEAFEKMGFVSKREHAPTVNTDIIVQAPQYAAYGYVPQAPKVQQGCRINYKELQEEPYKSASLDWSRCQGEIAWSAFTPKPDSMNPKNKKSQSTSTKTQGPTAEVSVGPSIDFDLEEHLEGLLQPVTLTVLFK